MELVTFADNLLSWINCKHSLHFFTVFANQKTGFAWIFAVQNRYDMNILVKWICYWENCKNQRFYLSENIWYCSIDGSVHWEWFQHIVNATSITCNLEDSRSFHWITRFKAEYIIYNVSKLIELSDWFNIWSTETNNWFQWFWIILNDVWSRVSIITAHVCLFDMTFVNINNDL